MSGGVQTFGCACCGNHILAEDACLCAACGARVCGHCYSRSARACSTCNPSQFPKPIQGNPSEIPNSSQGQNGEDFQVTVLAPIRVEALTQIVLKPWCGWRWYVHAIITAGDYSMQQCIDQGSAHSKDEARGRAEACMQKFSNAARLQFVRKMHELELGLRNCRALALRMSKTEKSDAWAHILRFCEEAGVKAHILRVGIDEGDPSGSVQLEPCDKCGAIVCTGDITHSQDDTQRLCEGCAEIGNGTCPPARPVKTPNPDGATTNLDPASLWHTGLQTLKQPRFI